MGKGGFNLWGCSITRGQRRPFGPTHLAHRPSLTRVRCLPCRPSLRRARRLARRPLLTRVRRLTHRPLLSTVPHTQAITHTSTVPHTQAITRTSTVPHTQAITRTSTASRTQAITRTSTASDTYAIRCQNVPTTRCPVHPRFGRSHSHSTPLPINLWSLVFSLMTINITGRLLALQWELVWHRAMRIFSWPRRTRRSEQLTQHRMD